MSSETKAVERIVQEIQVLSPEDRIRLIGHIVDTILPLPSTGHRRPLIYGEFHGPRLSCEEDFREAEWHLEDKGPDGP
jgi:hypothetical protein